MPKLVLYYGLGIRGYHHLRTQYKDGAICFHLVRSRNRCSNCKSYKIIQKGFKVRTLRTLPIGRKKIFLVIKMRRFYCEQCQRTRFEDLLIIDGKKHYTRALERYVMGSVSADDHSGCNRSYRASLGDSEIDIPEKAAN